MLPRGLLAAPTRTLDEVCASAVLQRGGGGGGERAGGGGLTSAAQAPQVRRLRRPTPVARTGTTLAETTSTRRTLTPSGTASDLQPSSSRVRGCRTAAVARSHRCGGIIRPSAGAGALSAEVDAIRGALGAASEAWVRRAQALSRLRALIAGAVAAPRVRACGSPYCRSRMYYSLIVWYGRQAARRRRRSLRAT